MNHDFTQHLAPLLAVAVLHMPTERAEWDAARLAELAQLRHPATR